MNFVCLKWGNKYSSEFVNKLHNMLLRFYPLAELHCMTEDPTGIQDRINIIPLPDDNLEKWWWKMYLFNEEWMTLDNACFLDLDLVIQDRFQISIGDKPTLLRTDWIDTKEMWKGINEYSHKIYDYCEINSSILAWNKYTNRQLIWNHFTEHREKVLFLFKGIDNYLNHALKDSYDFLPPIAHSYWTTGETWSDKPVILFDYNEEKQDKVDIEQVNRLWN